MKIELKEKWLAALRSGKYVQGHRQLKNTNNTVPSYCCLGVLCDVIDPKGWSDEGDRNRHNLGVSEESYLPNIFLSDQASASIGLDKDVQTDLANINDTEHHATPFDLEIKHIEKNVRVSD